MFSGGGSVARCTVLVPDGGLSSLTSRQTSACALSRNPSAEVTAPRLYELVKLEGEKDSPVRNMVFRGLTFAGADWLWRFRMGIGFQY